MDKQLQRLTEANDSPRTEVSWLIAELLALLALFLIAFTGRDSFGDGVKSVLTALSAIVGLLGAAGGLVVIVRGVSRRSTVIWRVPLGILMAFLGLYTVVHVLS